VSSPLPTGRGQQRNARVVVLRIIELEEPSAKLTGFLNTLEMTGKFRRVFQRLKLRLRKRIVIGDVRIFVSLYSDTWGQECFINDVASEERAIILT